ncbi:Eukaryotic translation initiation factor 2C, partial [Perkinsus olseni]
LFVLNVAFAVTFELSNSELTQARWRNFHPSLIESGSRVSTGGDDEASAVSRAGSTAEGHSSNDSSSAESYCGLESLAGWNLVSAEGVGLSHTKRLQMAVRLFGPPLGETIGAAGNKVPICRWLLDLSSNAVFTTPAVATPPNIDDQSQSEGLLRIEARPPLHVTSNLSRVVELFLWQTLLRSNPPLTATPRLSNAS